MNERRKGVMLARLGALMEEWPAGQVVFHRADGRRGVVSDWILCGQGNVMLMVDYGASGMEPEEPGSFQATTPGTEDGDEWRDGAGVTE